MSPSERENETRERIRDLRKRAEDLGLHPEETKALFCLKPSQDNKLFIRNLKAKLVTRKTLSYLSSNGKSLFSKKTFFACAVVLFTYSCMPVWEDWNLRDFLDQKAEERCLLDLPMYMSEVLRPQVPCGICKSLKQVPVVHNISREEFSDVFAYTGVPVLIKGAIDNWGALENFSYDYFKELYTSTEGALDYVDENCQFFPYKTEFETLGDVFNMTDSRAALKNGTKPWYIGWSNCDSNKNEAGRQLRMQYNRPYFLPQHSSNMDIDWMFMGGPGFGASMHIDYVERPSWQAQVSGTKTWFLDPTPECWDQCHRMEVTVEKGDIIVLDTNIWYHSTRVNPGNISITIGAEYD